MAGETGLIARIMDWRPIRAWMHYLEVKGPVFAQGMTVSAFFSLFAALFIAFAIFMQVLGGNHELRDQLVDALANAVPGLIDRGDGGAIDPDALIESRIVGIGGIVASVSILVTAIGWIGTTRDGMRAVFGLPNVATNAVLVKLSDLGIAIGIGLLVVISAAGTSLTQNMLSGVVDLGAGTRVIAAIGQILLDVAIVLLLVRFAARIRMRWRDSLKMALACAAVFFVLKQAAALLFGGVDRNPLFASIAAVVILLIWLGFVNQTLLVSTAFVAVGKRGTKYRERVIDAHEEREAEPARQEARRRLEAMRLREAADRLEHGARMSALQKGLRKRQRR